MNIFDLLRKPDINSGIEEYNSCSNAILIDVREPDEYQSGHIEGSINIPLGQINQIDKYVSDKNSVLFVHCLSGARSHQAVAVLKQMGYLRAKNIGGIQDYQGKIMKGN